MHFDQVLGLAARAIEGVVDVLGRTGGEAGDDVADVEAEGGGRDAGTGAPRLRPGLGPIHRLGIATQHGRLRERTAGADIVGDADLAEKVQAGQIDFDRCIATPDMMAVVGRLGKVLGPRGLMPNPKLGTVTNDIAEAVKAAKGGQVEFRAEKAGLVHAGVGKASFTKEALIDNVKAFVGAVAKAKPSGAKGSYIKKVSLSSTMGPGVKLEIASVLG